MSESLRVLHLLASQRLTGIAEPVLAMCEGLRRRGHTATLAAPRDSKLLLHAHRRGFLVHDAFTLGPGWALATRLADLRALRECSTRYDIIHLHHTRTHWLAAVALGRARQRPVLVAHNHLSRPLRYDLLHRRAYRRLDALIEVFAGNTKLDARLKAPVFHLPGAVDAQAIVPGRDSAAIRQRLNIPQDAVVIAMWSRLDPDRNHRLLLEAFATLQADFPAAWLLFAGSGEYRKKLLELARRSGIERLVIAGRNDLAFDESRACTDILVQLAQGSDGSCRTVLEGMAAGLPVVGAKLGVIGDYLRDGESGLLVAPDDAAGLAVSLRRLLEDLPLRRRLGHAARADAVAHFDLDQQAARLEEIYRECLRKHSRQPI